MKITRRRLFGLIGAGAVAAVLPEVAKQTTVKLDPKWLRHPGPEDTFIVKAWDSQREAYLTDVGAVYSKHSDAEVCRAVWGEI